MQLTLDRRRRTERPVTQRRFRLPAAFVVTWHATRHVQPRYNTTTVRHHINECIGTRRPKRTLAASDRQYGVVHQPNGSFAILGLTTDRWTDRRTDVKTVALCLTRATSIIMSFITEQKSDLLPPRAIHQPFNAQSCQNGNVEKCGSAPH